MNRTNNFKGNTYTSCNMEYNGQYNVFKITYI